MIEDSYGHTPLNKALELADVYGIGFDEQRASRACVRLGICGAGGVAQSKYLPAINRLRTIWEPVEVTAIAEPRRAHAEKVSAIYGCRIHLDWREMIQQEELNGVLVTAPDDLHGDIGLACLESGLPVLIEKPITRSLVEAERLCRTAEETGMTLMTVSNKRYSPPYLYAKRFVSQGPVDNPALFAGKFNLGYDYVDLLEAGAIHIFDIARYLMGDVRTVRSVGVNRYNRNRQGYPSDNVTCQFEFASGAVGAMITTATALSLKPWERVEVYGDHAWLSVEDQHELLLYDSEAGPAKSWTPVTPSTLVFDEEFGGYMGIVENFCQVIRGAEEPLVNGRDGLRAYELCVASHLSMARSGEVILLPLDPFSADMECAQWLAAHRRGT